MPDAVRIEFSLRAKPGKVCVPVAEGRVPNITRALALAIQIEDQLRRGEARDYAEIAGLRGWSRERVSQLARLNFLAPDIQVEVVYLPPSTTGRYPVSEVALRRIANLLSWGEQREQWARLKEAHRL